MKRSRDETNDGPHYKLPSYHSRRELNGQSECTEKSRSVSGEVYVNAGRFGVNGDGECSSVDPRQKLTDGDALIYLEEVKAILQNQREKYSQFLDVMRDFKTQRLSTDDVIEKVEELFKGHNSLIIGFNAFLPKGREIKILNESELSSNKTVLHEEAFSFVKNLKNRFGDHGLVYMSFLSILNMHRKKYKDITKVYEEVTVLFDGHPDLLNDFKRFLPDSSPAVAARELNSSLHPAERSSARPATIDKIMDDGKVARIHDEHRRQLQEDDQDGRCGNVADTEGMHGHDFSFFEKVRKRLCNLDDYQAFLKCLHIYSTEIITRNELQRLMSDLLGKYPDLKDEFNLFLEHCENIDGFLAGVIDIKSVWNEGNLSRSEKGNEQKLEMESSKDDRYKHDKSIEWLDLSCRPSCTPSYRLLPEDYRAPSASQRTELDAEVLNDKWVSKTSGSEDYSFKHMQRNQYEEILFRCEDDRFELDIILESVSSTAKCAEELLANIYSSKINFDRPIIIEEYFSSMNLRSIECLYGDHGLDMIDMLRRDPVITLPIILSRLKQKQEEWTRSRLNFNKVWAQIYAKNHHKSIDQRSFIFKQEDSKNMSAKSLISEITDTNDKRQKQADLLPAVTAGFRQRILPHLEFDYSDMDILDDMHTLLKYSCKEMQATNNGMNKAMKLYTTFLEPMLAVPPRPRACDGYKDKNLKHLEDNAGSASGDEYLCQDINITKTEAPLPISNLEKEEGELSDSDDFEEGKQCDERSGYQAFRGNTLHCAGNGSGIDANDDDCVNGFDTGENASASVSATAGCVSFYEGHEEKEDVHDKVASEGEEECGRGTNFVGAVSKHGLSTAKPLTRHVPSLSSDICKHSRVFYGDDCFYVLFRLHQVLYERLQLAKTKSTSAGTRLKASERTSDLYARFVGSLYGLLDGSSDNTKFEDECRHLIGNQSYVLFTLDRLIYKLVKQLQSVAVDETDNKLIQLYEYEKSRSSGRFVDSVYYGNSRSLLHEANIYRFEYSSSPACLCIQLMDNTIEKDEVAAVSLHPHFADYLQSDFLSATHRNEPEQAALL